MNRRGAVVCCELCGHDTRAKDGICSRCRTSRPGEEAKGLSVLRFTTFTDTCLEFDEDDASPGGIAAYHGDTLRDDL